MGSCCSRWLCYYSTTKCSWLQRLCNCCFFSLGHVNDCGSLQKVFQEEFPWCQLEIHVSSDQQLLMNDFLCCAGTGSDHLYYWSCNCFQQVWCSEWWNDAHQVGSGNHGACLGPSAAFCHQTQEVRTISTQLQLLLLTYLYIYRITKLFRAHTIHARSTLQYQLFGICQDHLPKWEFPNFVGWLREV